MQQLPVATDDVDVLQRVTIQLFGYFHIGNKSLQVMLCKVFFCCFYISFDATIIFLILLVYLDFWLGLIGVTLLAVC